MGHYERFRVSQRDREGRGAGERYICGRLEKRGGGAGPRSRTCVTVVAKVRCDLLVSLCSTFKLPWGTSFQLGKTGGSVQDLNRKLTQYLKLKFCSILHACVQPACDVLALLRDDITSELVIKTNALTICEGEINPFEMV